MSLADFVAENVRIVERAELSLHPGHNLIFGPNGSGKTSLLEAQFLLGRGRSFRTRSSERLIRDGQPGLIVFGHTGGDTGDPIGAVRQRAVGVQVTRAEGTVAKIDGSFVRSLAELSPVFPVQAIDPGIHKLVEEGGHRRRRWMDWAVFHVEPEFIGNWTRYTRALKQRNAALRHRPDEAAWWDAELAALGESLAASRQRVLTQLQPYWHSGIEALSGLPVELAHSRGWSADASLLETLRAGAARDRARGVTHAGPHRGDVQIRLNGRLARETLSRGQQKLVAIAMVLAQIRLLQDVAGLATTLLLDDPAAELDDAHLARLVAQVKQLHGQLVTTALRADHAPFGVPDRTFHVEQGRVQTV